MNTFFKLGDQWGIASFAEREPGSTVDVSKSNGETKQVKLGDRVGFYNGKHVYAIAPRDPKPNLFSNVGDLSGILALFAKAKAHLKFPAIVLQASGNIIRINVAGERAKVPGSLSVTGERGDDGRRAWFGRVLTDGTFQPSAEATPQITDMLRAFAADPVKVAGDYGRLTGACCFCSIPLKDERSTAVGYGKICADHYGLPWGKKAPVADEEAMQRMEAEGDRLQTARDEKAKWAARAAMERG
jgi:Family of unknown function (DUF6011)